MLSGGLDSSLIAYHLNNMIENGEIECAKVHTFTLFFDGFPNNEWELVQKYSAKLKHVHSEALHIDTDSFKLKLSVLMKQQDIPILSISHLIHIEVLRQLKEKGFTVVLNGQGADEVFGGYFPKDIGYFLLDLLKTSPSVFSTEMRQIKKLWHFSYFLQMQKIVQAIIQAKLPNCYTWLKTKGNTVTENLPITRKRKLTFSQNRSHFQVFETQFNGILHYEDMSSMLNSIEMRSPFMDYRIVDYGLSLPSNFKLRNGYSKWILREALGETLPIEICWATWKLGYAVPKSILMNEIPIEQNSPSEKNLNDVWRDYNLNHWIKNFNTRK
jgi:asparagine synthase (glutamine-hydrolysing)